MQGKPLLLLARIDKKAILNFMTSSLLVKGINHGFEQEIEETLLFIR
jgi:hypothetical protein